MSKKKNAFCAALWMLGTVASFTAMALCVRELSAHMPTFQLLFLEALLA
jgi:hypothetical protein